jgi:hypothetical protein
MQPLLAMNDASTAETRQGTNEELTQALEQARAAEAHVLELMQSKSEHGPDAASAPSDAQRPGDASPADAPAPGATQIEIFRPMDRDALVISAGDHRVMVPMRTIRERLKAEGADLTSLTTGDLLDIAPYILEHPEEFEAIGEYTVASA